MDMLLTASRQRGATMLSALVTLTLVSVPARADYLVRTFADAAPASVRSPVPQLAGSEPLTVERPHEDSELQEPQEPSLDDESFAAAVQALLLCAIPPPMTTIIQTTTPPISTPTTTTPTVQQPGVPLPPKFLAPPPPETQIPGGPTTTAAAPEPASLVTALVGMGLTGIALWQRRDKKRKLYALSA